ncbi:hypothetical protein QYE76_070874 [Lolium multiflorum]|uniref:Uncharacterized protein n=1 Tax=Lolium multiflorum TaxID=4521 RepID=A0AAD8SJR7_LOLMU|nr:hypothetical protein QYE76_070874 [Lolium multiflorum]
MREVAGAARQRHGGRRAAKVRVRASAVAAFARLAGALLVRTRTPASGLGAELLPVRVRESAAACCLPALLARYCMHAHRCLRAVAAVAGRAGLDGHAHGRATGSGLRRARERARVERDTSRVAGGAIVVSMDGRQCSQGRANTRKSSQGQAPARVKARRSLRARQPARTEMVLSQGAVEAGPDNAGSGRHARAGGADGRAQDGRRARTDERRTDADDRANTTDVRGWPVVAVAELSSSCPSRTAPRSLHAHGMRIVAVP